MAVQSSQTRIATISTVGLRVAAYFFLRWALIPFLPPVVFTLFSIYVPAAISSYLTESKLEVVDEIDIALKETTLTGDATDDDANGNVDDAPVVAEEVDMVETVAVVEKPLNAWKTLLLGTPNPRSLALTVATFVINALVAAMVADSLYRGRYFHAAEELSFVRVGYVSDTEAKLLIREPDQSRMPITVEVHIKDPQPPFDNPLWQTAGGVRWTTNETDYTAVVTVPLRHSKQKTYEWRTSNNHTGEFPAPPKAGSTPELFGGKFTFLTTSCIIQRLPYNPLDHPLSIPGLRHLAKVLPTLGAQFMLFLGDFIYVDVPRRWGKSAENYRREYRQVYASPDWSAVGQNLSWIHVLDDHEIADDWDSNTTGVYNAAVDPWHHYQTAVNPPPARVAGAKVAREGATYFSFAQGPASFFMLDTRTYRSKNTEPFDSSEKTILGAEQLEDFLDWLARPEPKGVKWKIVASSVPFTKNWPINTQDTWGGFLAERRKVLEAMWDVSTRGYGVVIISGDRHEFAATKFPPPADGKWPEGAAVHEFSVSPLNQFYFPFPTYKQTDDEDVMMRYINTGNSKFGAIEIETLEEGEQSSLKYRLFIDGEETWNTVVLSPDAVVEEKVTTDSFWDKLRGRL